MAKKKDHRFIMDVEELPDPVNRQQNTSDFLKSLTKESISTNSNMSKKKRQSDIDDAEIYDDLGGMGDLSYPINTSGSNALFVPAFDEFEPLPIESTRQELSHRAKTLIGDVINVYYKSGEIDKPTYLDTVQKIEAMNLESLLFQVKASDHMLSTLMQRLNNTGSVDYALYRLIMEVQEKGLQLTMQVSNYVRNLPGYVKSLKFELQTNVDMVLIDNSQERLELSSDNMINSDPDNMVKRPQRGMRDFLKAVESAEKGLKDEGETIADNVGLPSKPDSLISQILNEKPSDLEDELLKENQ